VSACEKPPATKSVDLAITAEVSAAHIILRSSRRREEQTVHGIPNDGLDVLEDVVLSQDVAASANLKGMTTAIVPVIIDLLFIRDIVSCTTRHNYRNCCLTAHFTLSRAGYAPGSHAIREEYAATWYQKTFGDPQ